jgi:mannose-6-phosphate isomerase-like protein (cupin superfamily)
MHHVMDTPNLPAHPAARQPAPFELVDFALIPGVPCPCGTARRAFANTTDFPGTIHVTEIAADARVHYHRTLTETYFFLECEEDARMQLNDDLIPVRPGMCVMIRPGTRHRAVGRMRVLIVVYPKFDPHDEWFDEEHARAETAQSAVASGPSPLASSHSNPLHPDSPMLAAQSEPS